MGAGGVSPASGVSSARLDSGRNDGFTIDEVRRHVDGRQIGSGRLVTAPVLIDTGAQSPRPLAADPLAGPTGTVEVASNPRAGSGALFGDRLSTPRYEFLAVVEKEPPEPGDRESSTQEPRSLVQLGAGLLGLAAAAFIKSRRQSEAAANRAKTGYSSVNPRM